MGKAAAARKLASAAAFGGGGLSALGLALYGVLRTEATLARKAIGQTARHSPARRHRLVRPRPTRAGRQGRAARRLQRRRLRRRPGRGDPRCAARQRARRPRRPPGLPALVRRGRRAVRRPRRPGRGRPAHRLDLAVVLIGVNDITHQVLPGDLGPPPLRGRTPAARGGRGGRRRHLPRPRHDPADPAAAQAGRPDVVAPARRRADDLRGRAGRAHGLARRHPRPRVRRRARAAVRPGPVPPLRRRLPRAGRRAAAVLPGRARPRARTPRSGPRRCAARGCGRSPARPSRRSNTPGTELDGVEVGGSRRGVRGLWVELRHRRRHPETDSEAPEPSRAARRTRPATTPAPEPAYDPGRRQRPARSPGRAAGCWWRQSWLKIARMRSRLV